MRMRAPVLCWSAACLVLVGADAVVVAQSSRAEEHAARQAEKAQRLRPYEPTATERVLGKVDDILAGPPRGLYPFVGSIYSGGGLAFGAGVRYPVGDTSSVLAQTAWSLRNYKLVEGRFIAPGLADGALHLETLAQWIDAPHVAFYGVGPDTSPDARTEFEFRPSTVGATAAWRPGRLFALGGGGDYLHVSSSIADTASFLVGRAFAQLDSRESPGYTTSGGFYRVDVSRYSPRDGVPAEFSRLDVQANQFIPILRANWIIALRAAASFTSPEDGSEVPVYLMPNLGGGRELRGFRSFRFRDRHRMLLTAEYRWTPAHYLDMALFYEVGKVAPRASDLDFSGLRRTVGVGARFHTPYATVLRLEVARSDERMRLIAGVGPVF